MRDCSVSSALLFTRCREVGVATWLLQPTPFGLAGVFLLGQELGAGYLSSVAAFSLGSSWHARMPEAIAVKYRLHLLGGSRNVAPRASELQREAPGFGSKAHPARPTPSHCLTDALKTEEHTQMGRCLSFRPS